MTEFREGEPVPSFGENSGNDDGTENPILTRAREILARQSSAEEIAEDEARWQRNKVERIMAPKEQPVIRKVNENAMIELKYRARMAELEIKVKDGGRLTEQELGEWWMIRGTEIGERADRLVKKNRVVDAIFLVVKELATVSFS